MHVFRQKEFQVRFDWGLEGLNALASDSDVLVIVDVLCFSTCVCAAVSRGIEVFPYPRKDEGAVEFARKQGAVLAGSRSEGGVSLSPDSFSLVNPGAKVVLPSPNGSELSARAGKARIIAACLRNARAAAAAAMKFGKTVSVIAAGEKWKETGGLRPCFEDLLGAGAVIRSLKGLKSTEALAAEAVFNYFRRELGKRLMDCASGRELLEMGFGGDVVFSSRLDVSNAVPVMEDERYVLLGKPV